MNNSFMHFIFLLTLTTVLFTMVIAQDNNNSTLNNTFFNNKILTDTTLNNTNLNLTALNNSILDDTNDTSFMIRSDVKSNESVFEIKKPTKPIQNASKLGFIIQATPHGYV